MRCWGAEVVEDNAWWVISSWLALLQKGLPWATASQGFLCHEFPVSLCPSEVTSSDTELHLWRLHPDLCLQQCLLQCIFYISSSTQQCIWNFIFLKPVLAEEPCASVTYWIFTTWWSANTCFRATEPSCGQHKRVCGIFPQRSLHSILSKPCNFCPAFQWRMPSIFNALLKSIQRSKKNLKKRGERRLEKNREIKASGMRVWKSGYHVST